MGEQNYGQAMGYSPQFYPVQQQQPVYMNPAFSGLYNNVGYYNPQMHHFGEFVTPQSSQEASPASLSISALHDTEAPVKTSVGLSMGNLVVPTERPTQEQVPMQPVGFNGLVIPTQLPVMNKFALQPIPEDIERSMLPKPDLISSAIDEVNAHLSKSNKPAQDSNIGKKVNNWFTRLLDQRGQDYISSGKLTIDEVSKNAERILDDMISGRIDYGKQGQYIIQPVVINTLINYCSNKLAINKAIQYALGYLYNDCTNRMMLSNDVERLNTLSSIDDSMTRNITQSIAIVNQDIGIYEILHTKLKYVEATKNASSLFSLTNDLNNFKKQMKKRY